MNIAILGSRFQSPVLKSIPAEETEIKFFNEAEFGMAEVALLPGDKIYAESAEAILSLLVGKLSDPLRCSAIQSLQEKARLRELLSVSYPHLYFKQTSLQALRAQGLPKPGKFVIKPNRGFFAIAVRTVSGNDDLPKACSEIEEELNRFTPLFSSSTLSTAEDLILEEFIEGEEYAVDMYFTADGRPVVINICHHPVPERKEYFHTLYYTNQQVFEDTYELVTEFFEKLNSQKGFKNLPIHAEFRLSPKGLVPIELNVLRFGGFAYTDLVKHAYGFNPYQAFFDEWTPDWDRIWSERSGKHFAFVLGYNGFGLDAQKVFPNHLKFKQLFRNPLAYYEVDSRRNPIFALAYIEESDKANLDFLLKLEFRDFFTN